MISKTCSEAFQEPFKISKIELFGRIVDEL